MKTYLEYLFEKKKNKSDEDKFKDKIRQILRTYGSVPINKDDAFNIIKRIIGSEEKYAKNALHPSAFRKPILGENFDFNTMKTSNKARMYSYIKSLITSKTIRGDSFEGLIAGLYDGFLSESKASKYDVELSNGYKLSVKFLDSKSERPVLGNIKFDIAKFIKEKSQLNELTPNGKSYDTLKDLSLHEFLIEIGDQNSNLLLNNAFSDVTHFLFAYPDDNYNINCLLINQKSLIDRYILSEKYAPKQKGSYQVRISISDLFKISDNSDKKFTLIAPILTEEDFNYLLVSNDDDAFKLFGTDKNRMRGSILNSILKNGEFKKVKGKEVFVFDFKKYKEERGY